MGDTTGDERTALPQGATLYNVAAFRYGEVLAGVMVTDVFTCGPDCSIMEVAGEMSRRGVSSCVICDGACPVGIVTERDMVRQVVAQGCPDPRRALARNIMTPDPITLTPEDTLFDALSVLSKNAIKHLPVVDKGRLVGILTLRQLLKIRHAEPLVLIGELQNAQTVDDFHAIRSRMAEMAEERLRSNVDPVDVVLMLSHINTSIHKRLLRQVLEGIGEDPPARFCFFVSGSHGRRENLLFPDQDFGVIYDDVSSDRRAGVDAFFENVSKRFSELLNDTGFPYCSGGVMGQNAVWRRSRSDWKNFITELFVGTDEDHVVRYATLLFDAAPFFGDRDLFDAVARHGRSAILKHHNILRQMHEEEGSHKVPLGVFNWFITEKDGAYKGQIDMKRSGLIFLVEAARLLAVRNGLAETSTVERIRALVRSGGMVTDEAEYYENAYKVILGHTLRSQIEHTKRGDPESYYLDPKNLSERGREVLKEAFKAVSRLQDAVAVEFGQII